MVLQLLVHLLFLKLLSMRQSDSVGAQTTLPCAATVPGQYFWLLSNFFGWLVLNADYGKGQSSCLLSVLTAIGEDVEHLWLCLVLKIQFGEGIGCFPEVTQPRVQGLGFEYRPVSRARGLTFALCCFQHSGMLQACGMPLIFITVCQILSSWLLSHMPQTGTNIPQGTPPHF